MKLNKKALFSAGAVLALSAVGVTQIDKILRAGGVIAVVNAFGKDIDKGMNKLWNRTETNSVQTKVVPIITVGINNSNAIGAAQVMGPKSYVDKVVAVAQPDAKLPGIGLRIKALIPVSSKDVFRKIEVVEQVGVSGIVDIRL